MERRRPLVDLGPETMTGEGRPVRPRGGGSRRGASLRTDDPSPRFVAPRLHRLPARGAVLPYWLPLSPKDGPALTALDLLRAPDRARPPALSAAAAGMPAEADLPGPLLLRLPRPSGRLTRRGELLGDASTTDHRRLRVLGLPRPSLSPLSGRSSTSSSLLSLVAPQPRPPGLLPRGGRWSRLS